MILFFLLFVIPVLEVFLLIALDSIMNWSSVLAICGITALCGLWLMRGEDFSLWTLLESEIQNKRVPTEELLNAICLWGCGVALLIPGLLTDAIGFVLVIPICRQTAVEWYKARIKNHLHPPNL